MPLPNLNPYEKIVWEAAPSQWMNIASFAKTGIWLIAWLFMIGTVIINEAAIYSWLGENTSLDVQNFNLKGFSIGMLGGVWAMGLLAMLWAYLVTKSTRYILSTERLFTYKGVLNKHVDELELYRVKDYSQYSPLAMRIVGLGCVHVETSDRSHPYVRIDGIKDAFFLQGALRQHTELCRRAKGVRELDM